jgi:hypothetical protein
MKNLLCFLIPTLTIAAIIAELGKPNPAATYSTTANVTLLSDVERAAATSKLTPHH